jgi:hypothetical protein
VAVYAAVVNWTSALPALLGTIVGASVTLAADRVRWRRDQDQRRHDVRREIYAGYLAALHAASGGIRAVSLGDHAPETPKASAARLAFRSANLNAAREQVVLLAPAPVVRTAGQTFRELRELRDLAGAGTAPQSQEYQQVLTRYQLALRRLRDLMRADLGTAPLDEQVTL